MANRIPLVVDSSNYRIEELPAGDTIDLNAANITGATFTGVTTFSSAINADAGIKFPITQNDVADPNTLDDYEEGTFVAEIRVEDGTIGGAYQYSGGGRIGAGASTSAYDVGYAHTGRYVKIGGQVTVHIPYFRIPYQGYVGVPSTSNLDWAGGTRTDGGASGRDGHIVGVGSTPMVIGVGSLPFTATHRASGSISECRGATFRYRTDRLTDVSGPYVGILTAGVNELYTNFTDMGSWIGGAGIQTNRGPYTGYLYYDGTLKYSPGNGQNDYSQSLLGDITITYNTY